VSRWCKVASNLDAHPKIRKAGAMGREVFLFALRKVAELDDNEGRISLRTLEPWYVADQLMRTEAECAAGLRAAIDAALIDCDGEHYTIVGWDPNEWGRERSTDRVRKWRDSKRAANDNQMANPVPDETLGNVAQRFIGCSETDETHETARSEEIRSEEIREEKKQIRGECEGSRENAFSLVSVVEELKPKRGRPRKPKPSEPTESERASAMLILGKLGEHNGIRYAGSDAHVALIVRHLRNGADEMDLRYVVHHCAEELAWKHKPEMRHNLRPETLFGPMTFSRYIDAARTLRAQHEAHEKQREAWASVEPRFSWDAPEDHS
jgi:hypothetical protein